MGLASRCSGLLVATGVGACAQIAGIGDYSLCTQDCYAVDGASSGAGGAIEDQAPPGSPMAYEGDDGPWVASDAPGPDGPAAESGRTTQAGLEASDTGRDGMHPAESGPTTEAGDAPSSSCGPTDTTSNCGACGRSCEATHSTPSACTSGTCTYSGCASGWSDCDKTGADINGCECHTSACCSGGACQTAHANGAGQTFYDCAATGTFSLAQAMEACTAFTGNASQCVDATAGVCGSDRSVCSSGATQCYCWQYAGTGIGTVEHQTGPICPSGCPVGNGTAWN